MQHPHFALAEMPAPHGGRLHLTVDAMLTSKITTMRREDRTGAAASNVNALAQEIPEETQLERMARDLMATTLLRETDKMMNKIGRGSGEGRDCPSEHHGLSALAFLVRCRQMIQSSRPLIRIAASVIFFFQDAGSEIEEIRDDILNALMDDLLVAEDVMMRSPGAARAAGLEVLRILSQPDSVPGQRISWAREGVVLAKELADWPRVVQPAPENGEQWATFYRNHLHLEPKMLHAIMRLDKGNRQEAFLKAGMPTGLPAAELYPEIELPVWNASNYVVAAPEISQAQWDSDSVDLLLKLGSYCETGYDPFHLFCDDALTEFGFVDRSMARVRRAAARLADELRREREHGRAVRSLGPEPLESPV